MQQQIQLLQNEMDKLRSDNVKLYEKIKFVQSYPHKVSKDNVWLLNWGKIFIIMM